MDLGISGRTAIINGGSAGLGKGSALALAREGVNLVISARGEERLMKVAKDIASETGVKVTPVVADHSSDEGRARILAECPDPDIIVGTCCPPPFSGDFRSVTAEQWQENLWVGLISPIEFIKATVDGMADRGFGRIVNIATAAAKFPAELRVLSGPPRAALANYTTAISKSFAKHNVTINNLLPGMHHTATAQERFGQMAKEQGTTYDKIVEDWIRDWRIPAEKFGDADDFGALCAMLCSEHANYIIGQNIVVDGGVTNSTF